jgi:predicted acylesterase/phospholipase RssA
VDRQSAAAATVSDPEAAPVEVPEPGDPNAPGPIGVALSGGGVRAALFSLGVLIGLTEMGQNKRVTHVASVSGGSIVNAAVAQGCDFARTEPEVDFPKVTRPLADRLCRRGAFVISKGSIVALGQVLAPRFGGLVFFGFIGSGSLARLARDRQLSDLPWIPIVLAFLAFLGIVFVLTRGTLQEGVYASLLRDLKGDASTRLLADLPATSTTHVMVATDLVSGEPVYFSRGFVYCPAFGWGHPGRVKTATAVYASAAFPVVFPARRSQRKRYNFQDGSAAPPYPRRLKLTDGGVYNNLGTDWFDVIAAESELALWRFGNLHLDRALEPVTTRIIVNAGAASRGFRRVLPFLSIRRTMSVLYDNTVRPRIQALTEHAKGDLDAPIVIDISESPYAMSRRLAGMKEANFGEHQRERVEGSITRAMATFESLGTRGEAYWIEFARQTSSTKTKLTSAGMESGARMMLHGYLSTIIALHVIQGLELPEVIRDEGYFLDLAGRSPTRSASPKDEPPAAAVEPVEPAETADASVAVDEGSAATI